MSDRQLKDERAIGAPPETVAKAIASPNALGTWLCDEAQVERRPGGRLLFAWRDGRLLIGRWTAFSSPTDLAWRLADESGDDPLQVAFGLSPAPSGTRLVTTITGIGDEASWRGERTWHNALVDLQVLAESGLNNRLLRRPTIGISFDVVGPELARKEGLAVDRGILVTGTAPEGGAARAGLARGDVLVAIDGQELGDWASLVAALDGHAAGDTVHVRLHRGSEAMTIDVTLAGRPTPEAPEGRTAISSAYREATSDWIARLEAVLAGVTDIQAELRPAESEWSTKEVLMHLSTAERFGHDWLCRLATDSRPAAWPEEFGEHWKQAAAAFPIADLARLVAADLRQSEALALAILASDPLPWVERSIAESIAFTGEHLLEHIAQIEANLKPE